MGMTSFVIGDETRTTNTHDPILLLRTSHHALDGIADFVVADFGQFTTSSEDGSLIQKIGQVGTGVAGSTASNFVEVNVLGKGLATGVNSQDLETTCVIGSIDGDLTVETSGTHQRCVENIRTVRCRNNDDSCISLETIHLGEELVEGLLTLIVATTQACTALAADGINFVDENDARGVFLGLLEEVTNPACTDTDEHLDEFRTRNRKEGNTGFSSYGLGQESFARTWRSD